MYPSSPQGREGGREATDSNNYGSSSNDNKDLPVNSSYPSLFSFKQKVDKLKEVICPFRESFAKVDGRTDNAVNFWAQWQSEEIQTLIRTGKPILSTDHLMQTFHLFRITCWNTIKDRSLWLDLTQPLNPPPSPPPSPHQALTPSRDKEKDKEKEKEKEREREREGGLWHQASQHFALPIQLYPHHEQHLRPDVSFFYLQKELFDESETDCSCEGCLMEFSSNDTDSAKNNNNIIDESECKESEQKGEGEGEGEKGKEKEVDSEMEGEEKSEKGRKKSLSAKNLFSTKCAKEIRISIWGDLHGSVHSLLRILNNLVDPDSWKIQDRRRKLVFLGDFVDRGAYSLEVLYALLWIKIANPDDVFLIRGDHEMFSMNKVNHFSKELLRKYPAMEARKILRNIGQLYSYMPVTLFASFSSKCSFNYEFEQNFSNRKSPTKEEKREGERDFIQFSHGGVEMGFVPSIFLIQPKETKYQLMTVMDRSLISPLLSFKRRQDSRGLSEKNLSYNGFMWADFVLDPTQTDVIYHPGRGYMYSKQATEIILDHYETPNLSKISLIFRGHQHSVDQGILFRLIKNEGVYPLWYDNVRMSLTSEDEALEHEGEKMHDVPHNAKIDNKYEDTHIIELNLNSSDSVQIFTLLSAPSSSLLFGMDNFVELIPCGPKRAHWRAFQISKQCEPSITGERGMK